ncbi:putative metal-dependent hydrolase [Xanthomonas sacchari]|uniref:M48 metallopeptidase family protein n=1 Tax=Xanthomonas sacchari TaxID=56458 RepID=UPI002783371E|nr:M48 family metallopeptidase [Xanthomonas sacchari]MDQ1094204.1 putative metal-dependent hydrolase [Xanthomonas sacchari]
MKPSGYPAQDLKRRAMTWAVKLKVNPRVVRVQEMRKKWGSCSSSGIITLAVDLLDRDPRFQDYVIVHELLHLRYSTHGKVFKALMSAHVPDWRQFDVVDEGTLCGGVPRAQTKVSGV